MASNQKKRRTPGRSSGVLVRGGQLVGRIGRHWRPIAAGAAGSVLGGIFGYLPLNKQVEVGELSPSIQIQVGRLLEEAEQAITQMDAISQMSSQARIKKYGSEEKAKEAWKKLFHKPGEKRTEAERISGIKFTGTDFAKVRQNRADSIAKGIKERELRTERVRRNAVAGIFLGAGAFKGIELGIKRRKMRMGRR